jgi:hypothetical protein
MVQNYQQDNTMLRFLAAFYLVDHTHYSRWTDEAIMYLTIKKT